MQVHSVRLSVRNQLHCSISHWLHSLSINVSPGEQQLERMANTLTVDDISEFLTKIKLGHYVQLFTDNDVDGRLLLKLTDGGLKDLGVDNEFHRRKIISKFEAHILELISKQEQ